MVHTLSVREFAYCFSQSLYITKASMGLVIKRDHLVGDGNYAVNVTAGSLVHKVTIPSDTLP